MMFKFIKNIISTKKKVEELQTINWKTALLVSKINDKIDRLAPFICSVHKEYIDDLIEEYRPTKENLKHIEIKMAAQMGETDISPQNARWCRSLKYQDPVLFEEILKIVTK